MIVKTCDFIAKKSLFALIFILPLFFLPLTIDVLDFSKQYLMIFLVFLSAIAWMIASLVSKKLVVIKTPLHIVAIFLLVAMTTATIFSQYKFGSFFGASFLASESLVSILCFLVFFFLVSNIFSKKDAVTSFIIFLCSAVVAQIFGVLQLFGYSLGLNNTIGSFGSLGIFAVIAFPVAVSLFIFVKNWWRVLFIFQIVLSLVLAILIQNPEVWIVFACISAFMLIFCFIKKDFADARWMAFPAFILVISVFFAIYNPQFDWPKQKVNEVYLPQEVSFNIAVRSIKENPIFGSGPGTFSYNFLRFKSPEFSNTDLGSLSFNASASKILDYMATTGVVGVLAILLFMVFVITLGIKHFTNKHKGSYDILIFGALASYIGACITYFVYNPALTLDFCYFFFASIIVVLVSKIRPEYELKPFSRKTLFLTVVFTIICIFILGLFVVSFKNYFAEIKYYQSMVSYQVGDNKTGLKKLEQAVNLNKNSDVYFRQLAQAYLFELSTLSSVQDEERFKTLISDCINASNNAIKLNPQNASNLALAGFIYQNMIGIVDGAKEWALKSYQSALELDPQNKIIQKILSELSTI